MTETPQRARVRSLPSIARSICRANSTSAGCLDGAADGGGLAVGGVAEVPDSFRGTRLVRPISKRASEHRGRTTSDRTREAFRLVISIPSNIEQRGWSACPQNLTRVGLNSV